MTGRCFLALGLQPRAAPANSLPFLTPPVTIPLVHSSLCPAGVNTLAFSPDGRTLASAGADELVILWNVDVTVWQQQACAIANRNLTQAEWEQFFGDEPYRQTCPAIP